MRALSHNDTSFLASSVYRLAMAACFLTGSFFAVRAFQADVPSAFPAAKADIQTSDAAAITPYAESQSELITQNIEDIRLGQRVVGTNPLREQTQPASDIQPDIWRTVRLTMFKSGVTYDLAFLRPLSWLQSKGAKVGGSIHMELHEMGLNGPAEVIGIDPCPDIEPDDGTGRNVVTGTMGHPGPNIVYLDITGLDEPLGVTDTHPIWSETRHDFIEAGFLKIGEQFRTLTGESATLTKITPHRGSPEMVFNLEVDSEHVYSVASNGLLVHNDCVTLYHGSPNGVVGDGFDLDIANSVPGRSYTPEKGVYLTNDFDRAYSGYAGPGGTISSVSVPREMAERMKQLGGPDGDAVEYFTNNVDDIAKLNETFQQLPAKDAFVAWVEGSF